jgi:hypothetical protein
MAAKITTEPFGSISPHQRHAVTIHLPTWDTMMRFADRDMELIKQFKNFYPRILLHKDVKEVGSIPSLPHLSLNPNQTARWQNPGIRRSRTRRRKNLHLIHPPSLSNSMYSLRHLSSMRRRSCSLIRGRTLHSSF